jgi:hypothetical protein
VPDKKAGFVIVNLMREFLGGHDAARGYYHWTNDYSKAMMFKDVMTVNAICEPIALKAYVVMDYGLFTEKEIFKNFGTGRGLIWGRWGQDDNNN